MNTTDRQITFSALSCLLSYPDEEWRAELPDWKALIQEIGNRQPANPGEAAALFRDVSQLFSGSAD